MGNYQVLFSGEVSPNLNEETVRENLARELGIDELKVKQLFSGRTVVIKASCPRRTRSQPKLISPNLAQSAG